MKKDGDENVENGKDVVYMAYEDHMEKVDFILSIMLSTSTTKATKNT